MCRGCDVSPACMGGRTEYYSAAAVNNNSWTAGPALPSAGARECDLRSCRLAPGVSDDDRSCWIRCYSGRLPARGVCRLVVVPGGQRSSGVGSQSTFGKPIYVPNLFDRWAEDTCFCCNEGSEERPLLQTLLLYVSSGHLLISHMLILPDHMI